MIRTLLASTAMAGLLATAAFAQAPATQSTTESPAMATPAPQTNDNAAGNGSGMSSAQTADVGTAANSNIAYVQKLEPDQYLASKLSGANLYESNSPDAKSVGEIQNFVIGNDGKVAAVVISTSGLDQNKIVAAPVDKVEWMQGQDGSQRAVLKGGVAELQTAPAFTSDTAQKAAQNGAMTPGSGAMSADGSGNMAASNTATGVPAQGGNQATASSASMGSANGYLAALGNDQKLSEDIIGSNVYSGPGSDAQTVGSVNDLVLTKTGEVPVVLVGVGGFLGIGEKDVGVPFQNVQVQTENGNSSEPRMVLAATKDQLTNAPTFDQGNRDSTNVAAAGAATGTALGMGGETGTAQNSMAQGNMATDTTTAAQNATGAAAMNADPSTTASTTNDRSSMAPVTGPDLTADNLNGVTVYGPNDKSIGKVGDIALTGDGRVDAIIVDVGGFLGIGSKPVAVAMDNLQIMRDTNGKLNVYTQFTQDQLKSAPEFNRDSYAQNRDSMRIGQGNVPAANGENNGQTAQ